jgi:hypothetical protein
MKGSHGLGSDEEEVKERDGALYLVGGKAMRKPDRKERLYALGKK